LKGKDRISEIIESDCVLYAIGQGALGIECRHNDNDTIQMLSVLNHEPTVIRCIAERAFLKRSKDLSLIKKFISNLFYFHS
jgi:hydroxymethylbilane synthase